MSRFVALILLASLAACAAVEMGGGSATPRADRMSYSDDDSGSMYSDRDDSM